MGHHIVDGDFKSDKYDWCPKGYFPLKTTDRIAQFCMVMYATMCDDDELALDLFKVVRNKRVEEKALKPAPTTHVPMRTAPD